MQQTILVSIVREVVAPGGSSTKLAMGAIGWGSRVVEGVSGRARIGVPQYEGTKKLLRPRTRAPQEPEL